MADNNKCKFCGGDELRPDMWFVADLHGGRLYLLKDQTHPGRVLFASTRHVKKVTDLTREEYDAMSASIYCIAHAVTDVFHPDKLNYLVFGDNSEHLHVHIVPKYKNGPEWGKVFMTDYPEPTYLNDDKYQEYIRRLRNALGVR